MRDTDFPVKTLIGIIIAVIAFFIALTFTGSGSMKPVDEDILNKKTVTPEVKGTTEEIAEPEPESLPATAHINTPENVRAVYVSAYSFMTESFRLRLDKMIETTSINSIVVDIKDAPGTIMFDIGLDEPCVKPSMDADALDATIKRYHDKNIYIIARIAVFRDECFVKLHPELAVQSKNSGPWRDKGGHYWLAPHEQVTREYIRNIANSVYAKGFDEIQLDYIRYPSDGNMSLVQYEYASDQPASSTAQDKRRDTINDFMSYMRRELAGKPLSADIFGMVLTNKDDLSIGQHLDEFVPNTDFISPMIYPSHFPKQWNGIADTNKSPYQTIYQSTKQGLDRMIPVVGTSTARKMMRPWLQDFSLYGVVYNAPEVKAQIKALDDLGVKSFLLWNASNRYTPGVL